MNSRFFLSIAFLLVSTLMSQAGGSVHRDDIQGLMKTNPVLAKLIQKNFAVGEVGGALRLGKHMGDLGGSRIGPYEFPAVARPDGSEVILILNTDVTVRDAQGKIFQLDQLTPQSTGLSISETLLSYEVKVAKKAQSIGDIVGSLSEGSLNWIKAEFESDDEPGFGVIRKGHLKNDLRRVILHVNMGDHYAVGIDVFADAQKKPVFVLITESSWSFVAPEKTEETVKERRLYFENEKLTKVLEKSYRYREESQKVAKRDAAVNKKVEVGALMGMKWYGRSQALLYENSKLKLRKLAEEFADFK